MQARLRSGRTGTHETALADRWPLNTEQPHPPDVEVRITQLENSILLHLHYMRSISISGAEWCCRTQSMQSTPKGRNTICAPTLKQISLRMRLSAEGFREVDAEKSGTSLGDGSEKRAA